MKIGFLGLGKLGLPCALATESKGHQVIGYDPDARIRGYLQKRRIPYREEGANEFLMKTSIQVKSVKNVLQHSEIIFVAVQTPHDEKYEGITRLPEERVDFDYSYLIRSIKLIKKEIYVLNRSKKYKDKKYIISVISTVLPGTMREKILPLVQNMENVHVIYNPFFIAMGTTIYDYLNPEFILLGINDIHSCEIVSSFYNELLPGVKQHKCSVESAEAIKVLYNCYSEDTEVLSSNGWCLIKDVDSEARILSINPENQCIEWVDIERKVGRKHDGKMIHFKSRFDDILVTPEHNMYAGMLSSKSEGDKNYSRNWKLIPAKDLIKRNAFSFIKKVNWKGLIKDKVVLCSKLINCDTYARFMAWFLSEGHVHQYSYNSYQITISQDMEKNKSKYELVSKSVLDLINELGLMINISESKTGVIFYHKELGEYLLQFGNSFEKYVPQIIKEMSSEHIRTFLDNYNLADGSAQKVKGYDGELTGRLAKYYATASNKMAADIGELIIKAGMFPSYRTTKSVISGKMCWLIYELISQTSNFQRSSEIGINYEEVEYNGYVYCVLLKENHVFLTRRNGKCTWQGNTYITQKITFANAAMELCEATEADVDDVIDGICLGNKRIISTAYMRPGMVDGGGCFPAGQLVMTYNGMKPIEEINEGDLVLSGYGEFCKVIKSYVRDYEGDMILLKTKGLPHTLMTSDHPVISSTDLRQRVPDGRRNTSKKISELMSDHDEVNASDLTYDNMLYWPEIKERKLPGMPNEYLELAGWYLSEGSLELNSRRGRIRFDLNAKEIKYAERIKELIEMITSERFGLIPKRKNLRGIFSKVTIKINGNSLSVRFGSKALATLLYNDFGKGAKDKFIKPEILWSKESEILLKGLILGDGHRSKNGISYTTISKDLAWGVYIILHRLDLCPSIKVIPSRGIHKQAYEVRIRNKSFASKLCNIIGWEDIPNPVEIENYVKTNIGTYRHITQIHKVLFKGPVYNLWIDRHNTYVVPCGVVHNCHPRDNIALSAIARKYGLNDWWGTLMLFREKQTEYLVDIIWKVWDVEYPGLTENVFIMGKTFKPETNLIAGSPAILFYNILKEKIDEKYIYIYDPHVQDNDIPEDFFVPAMGEDVEINRKYGKAIFFIATKHEVFKRYRFPDGSLVIDPWRYIPQKGGACFHYIGKKNIFNL